MNAASDRPDISLSGAEWLMRGSTQRVFQALTATGHEARAVGGCVRDTLLATLTASNPEVSRPGNIGEAADIDIATTSPPEETMQLAEAAGLRAVPTGLDHGTITIISEATPYEVTTLRHDVETYGRHADVAFTDDWAVDAARRDFTINALYANPDGSIFDPLNAIPDLLARRVRFVGDPYERIREDYLRILRFFRFFARFGEGPPEPESLQACVSERAGLARLSRERIGHEMLRLLVTRSAASTLSVMAENGLLTQVLPIAPTIERFARYAKLEEKLTPSCRDAAMRLAALTIAVDENAPRISDVLRLSNEQTRTLHQWAELLRCSKSAGNPDTNIERPRQLKHALYRLGKDDYRRSILIECSLATRDSDLAGFQHDITLPERWTPPRFPIAGRDLIELGITPGPDMGDLLASLEAEWIASEFALTESQLKERITSQLPAAKK